MKASVPLKALAQDFEVYGSTTQDNAGTGANPPQGAELPQEFVQIERTAELDSATTAWSLSLPTVIQFLQRKYYSLLKWRIQHRTLPEWAPAYDRLAQFGRWKSSGGDCLNTRAKVLVRDSSDHVIFKENNGCVVNQGAWSDPYTTNTFHAANEIQIDHLVPLKNAFVSGAYRWTNAVRCVYANFLGNNYHLLSVSGSENMRKSDRTPAEYMPPNQNYACTYIRNWLAVKMFWGLRMDPAEAGAIRRMLNEKNCAPETFRISEAEVDRQRRFAQSQYGACENKTSRGLTDNEDSF